MKITLLYGAAPNHSLGLADLVNTVMNVMTELGIEMEQFDLPSLQIPYFDGDRADSVDRVAASLRESGGVILATTAVTPAPSATLQNFLEYCTLSEYRDLFENKNCMVLVVSRQGGERACLESLSHTLNALGACDSVRVGLRQSDLQTVGEKASQILEKQLEDYFRIVRQSRQFLIPTETFFVHGQKDTALSPGERAVLQSLEKKKKVPVTEVIQKLELDRLNENQARDVDEITKHFARKFSEPEPISDTAPIFVDNGIRDPIDTPVHAKTCKQLAQRLPHFFQPEFAQGLNAVLQLQVSGDENFTGYYAIADEQCIYNDGVALNPDLTILTDAVVWRQILTGKYSAQKAFMIGRLKVKGNYVILTKFDHLFSVKP